MKNRQVARILYEIAELLGLEGIQFKPRAYRRAAQAVESCGVPIEELASKGRLNVLPDVGKAGAVDSGLTKWAIRVCDIIPTSWI